MSIELPRYVFKPHTNRADQVTTLIVTSTQELNAALKDGWTIEVGEKSGLSGVLPKDDAEDILGEYTNIPGANTPFRAEEVDTTSAPTREELEAKAAELGIKHHPAIGDANLLKKINEALKDNHVVDKKAVDSTGV